MNRGIVDAIGAEVVTAVSVMVVGPELQHDVARIRSTSPISRGLHLTFTQAKPLSPADRIPSLVTAQGEFYSSVFTLACRRLSPEQLRIEADAQLQRYVDLLGAMPEFVNTHQHAQMIPVVLNTMLELCARYGIERARLSVDRWPVPNTRLRSFLWPMVTGVGLLQRSRYATAGIRHPAGMIGGPASEHLTPQRLRRLLSRVGDGLTELVVHPSQGSNDMDALTSSSTARIIEERAIEKVGFHVL